MPGHLIGPWAPRQLALADCWIALILGGNNRVKTLVLTGRLL
jgi:hypothetical protein